MGAKATIYLECDNCGSQLFPMTEEEWDALDPDSIPFYDKENNRWFCCEECKQEWLSNYN